MALENDPKEMSFFDHLAEMRTRLVRSAVVVIILALIIFVYTQPIIDNIYIGMSRTDFVTYRFFCWISEILGLEDSMCAQEINLSLQSIKMTGQFSTNIYFSFIGGIIIAFPYIFHQVWGFVKPALKAKEVNASRGVLFWASLLFILGILFGYFLIAPLCVQFFGNYTMSEAIENNFTISDYISMITTTTFWTGLLFELPVVIYLLSKMGVVGPEVLARYRKHAVVVVLIVAAIITPPDFFSQIIVAIPILILYEISILISKRTQKK